jgi:hypothetical protein
MSLARIVLTQRGHMDAWRVDAGTYVLINGGTRQTLGPTILASLVARRETILQVTASYSMDDAAEKYHNPNSPSFKRLLNKYRRDHGGPPIYHGTELLLYVHGPDILASFLLATVESKRELERLQYAFKQEPAAAFNATRFKVKTLGAVGRFYIPTMAQSDLTWTNRNCANDERRLFEAASRQPEPFKVPAPITEAVDQFKRAVKKAGGRVSREFDRVFNNLIQQANDGDYELDDIIPLHDFH